MPEQHTYQCGNCRTVLLTPFKLSTRCRLCQTPMRRLWTEDMDWKLERELWNPTPVEVEHEYKLSTQRKSDATNK